MSEGRKQFTSLWDFNGNNYTDLTKIPLSCKLLFSSELPMPDDVTKSTVNTQDSHLNIVEYDNDSNYEWETKLAENAK